MDADDSHLEQRVIENEQRLYAQEKLFYDNMEKYASAKNSKMITDRCRERRNHFNSQKLGNFEFQNEGWKAVWLENEV